MHCHPLYNSFIFPDVNVFPLLHSLKFVSDVKIFPSLCYISSCLCIPTSLLYFQMSVYSHLSIIFPDIGVFPPLYYISRHRCIPTSSLYFQMLVYSYPTTCLYFFQTLLYSHLSFTFPDINVFPPLFYICRRRCIPTPPPEVIREREYGFILDSVTAEKRRTKYRDVIPKYDAGRSGRLPLATRGRICCFVCFSFLLKELNYYIQLLLRKIGKFKKINKNTFQ